MKLREWSFAKIWTYQLVPPFGRLRRVHRLARLWVPPHPNTSDLIAGRAPTLCAQLCYKKRLKTGKVTVYAFYKTWFTVEFRPRADRIENLREMVHFRPWLLLGQNEVKLACPAENRNFFFGWNFGYGVNRPRIVREWPEFFGSIAWPGFSVR